MEDAPGDVRNTNCGSAYVPGAGEAVGGPMTVPLTELPDPPVNVPVISDANVVEVSARDAAIRSAGTRVLDFMDCECEVDNDSVYGVVVERAPKVVE
jgi:hypothetical protein